MDGDDVRASVWRLSSALVALGVEGARTEEEHLAAVDELGGPDAYRAWLASALLGAAQAEAMVADRLPLSRDSRYAVWQRQLDAAGVSSDPARRAALIQWQVRRASAQLPAIAQEHRSDPIPLAAAQAAEALQTLLAVGAATRGAVEDGDVRRLAVQASRLREARKALQAALDNTDVLLELLGSVDL
ncbi:DUF6245 family protein [Actinoplanes sp. NPDC049265]|uniref:DUF6245 family protein n=1 Tax=Actinoplanes sp. NPDC049265 TaxID=3363902 RepID=UPI003715495A